MLKQPSQESAEQGQPVAPAWNQDAQLTSAIRSGVDDEGAELCSTMPKFSTLSDSDVAAIIAYLRSQPATHSEIPESSCPPIKP